jgi:hypothetical protein
MPVRTTEPLACGASAVQRRSSSSAVFLNVVSNLSGLTKIDRVLPMRASISSVGGVVWRSPRSFGYAAIGSGGQLRRNMIFLNKSMAGLT